MGSWKKIQSRRVLAGLGALVFLAGVAMVAIGLFSYFEADSSTSQSSTRPRSPLAETPTFTPRTVTPTPTDAPASPTPTPPSVLETAYRMIIEKIEVDAPVRVYGLDENAVPEVPTGDDAAQVVAWYDFSANPGTGSNAVFSGHVTWFGQAVFWDLKKLEPGDMIRLEAEDGTELVYAVSDSFLVDPADPESLKLMHGTDTDVITLITCDGDFVDTNDPIFGGEYTDRRVVRAELVSMNLVGVPEAATADR